jgi:hypothetical protein
MPDADLLAFAQQAQAALKSLAAGDDADVRLFLGRQVTEHINAIRTERRNRAYTDTLSKDDIHA